MANQIDQKTKRQIKETKLKVLAATSELVKRPMTDLELANQMREWEQVVTDDEVTKLVSHALKEGIFVLSPTKVPDAEGKKMLRQTGIKESVPNGINLKDQQERRDEELVDSLAAVVAVRLNTTLRRQENITLSVEKLTKMLSESLSYVMENGGIARSAMRLLGEMENE